MAFIAKKPKMAIQAGEVVAPIASAAVDGQTANRVFVSMGKTLNLGDYQALRVDYGESRAVPDGSSFEDVRKVCAFSVATGLGDLIDEVKKQFGS